MEHVVKSQFFFSFLSFVEIIVFFFKEASVLSLPEGTRDETGGQWCSGTPGHQGSQIKCVIGKKLMLLIDKKKSSKYDWQRNV